MLAQPVTPTVTDAVKHRQLLHTHPFYSPLDFVRDYPGEMSKGTVKEY